MRLHPQLFLKASFALAGVMALPASAVTLGVGPGKAYATPCQAFAAAKSGDIVEIQGNNAYRGDVCGIYTSNLTIRGVNGRPVIDAAGRNAMGKGTWVIVGNNIIIDNVEMFGAKVPDQNGAALRLEGVNFTLRSSYLHDNENGVLANAVPDSNILMEYNEFALNGDGAGYTHNLYIGNVASLTFRHNYSHDANVGHNLKSRARINTIAYNRFSSLPEGQAGSGKPSYEINVPNAGTTYIIGNVIQQPSANSNPSLIAYGEEGASNPSHDLYIVNNTFLNDDSSRGTFVYIGTGVTKPALLQNNIFAGTGTLSTQSGAIEKTNYRSAAPGFVNRATYDLHPTVNALVIDAGSAPGTSASGLSLAPVAQYKHVAATEDRTVSGLIDIGAYEALSTISVPSPVPAPAPSTWTTCASEGASCSFIGTAEVRYGSPTAYVTKTLTGPVTCTNAVFGDPAPGVVKSCSIGAPAVLAPAPVPAPAPAPVPVPSPTPAPTPTAWISCAAEGGTCMFNGTLQIRYGTPTAYYTRSATSSIECSNAVFGDPSPGVVKSCSYGGASVSPPVVSWTSCATENGTCTVPGTREVRYGVGNSYVSKIVTGLIACTNAIFGDPAQGIAKSCSFSSILG